ncbi:MAG: NAD-dependent deacylase [Bacteroidales bacterium]|nr:NAD-dependent deacylase [Bacteroidales bacterium]
MNSDEKIARAAQWIREAKHTVVFTGAGISANSGIPTFRGEGGIWKEIDPNYFNIEFFQKKPLITWKIIKKVFYDKMIQAQPNLAHFILAIMEQQHKVQTVITQNIDHLHQDAGSRNVLELHGSYKRLVCTKCNTEYDYRFADLNFLPPTCFVCRGTLKPDFVFFNEKLPSITKQKAIEEAEKTDLLLIIGTRAEVFPANTIPRRAKENGAKILEINLIPTEITHHLTDLFLQGDAEKTMKLLCQQLTCSEQCGCEEI